MDKWHEYIDGALLHTFKFKIRTKTGSIFSFFIYHSKIYCASKYEIKKIGTYVFGYITIENLRILLLCIMQKKNLQFAVVDKFVLSFKITMFKIIFSITQNNYSNKCIVINNHPIL